jgi:hypothetical protein
MLGDAFSLAYFVMPDRFCALEIVARAMEKLKVQRSRERRRFYWRGRSAESKIRKISRPEEDALQWLVYLESEIYEREQEREGRQTGTDMTIRYVKHLSQLTTCVSSFYVNVGLNRLLRNYSTPETQQVYEFVTEHYPGSEEYRKVKGKLMKQLATRFDRFLEVQQLQYRETRFEPDDSQESWQSLIEECLDRFTPWSSKGACLLPPASWNGHHTENGIRFATHRDRADRVETSRCHWFMHPACYSWLAKRLGLDAPETKLSVPKFLLKSHIDGEGGNLHAARRGPEPLTTDELQVLQARFRSVDTRPREIELAPLKIVAHGALCARFNPTFDQSREFAIQAGTGLLEIRTDAADDEHLLAAHWIDYTESSGIAGGEYAIPLKGGRELLLTVIPAKKESEQEGDATVIVEARPAASRAFRIPDRWTRVEKWHNLRRYASISLAAGAIVWLGMTAIYRNRLQQEQRTIGSLTAEIASRRAPVTPPETASLPAVVTVSRYFFGENSNLRGEGGSEEQVVAFTPGNALVMLELPVAREKHELYRATLSSFMDQTDLLTESELRPSKGSRRRVVEFALPASLVSDNTHYLMTLSAIDSKNVTRTEARFLLKIRKMNIKLVQARQ